MVNRDYNRSLSGLGEYVMRTGDPVKRPAMRFQEFAHDTESDFTGHADILDLSAYAGIAKV
jgi:hypothetical protein